MSDDYVEVAYPGGTRIRTARCAGFDNGKQCTEPGTISAHSGSRDRFCWQHAKAHLQPQGSPPPGGFESLKSIIQDGPRQLDFEAIGERLALQRKDDE